MQSITTDKPSTERLTLFIDPALNTDIRVGAAKTRLSISDFAAEGLRYYIKNYTRIKAQAEKATKKDPEF